MVPFPFSDLSASKLRPAVVLADAGRGDWTLCMVTSNPYGDTRTISIDAKDLIRGRLNQQSFVRPLKLFTAHQSLIVREVGRLRKECFQGIVDAVIKALRP